MVENESSILIVDDSLTARAVFQDYLQSVGHRVQEAENGRQALDLLQKQSFDLVLSDIDMPEMDGLTFLKALRRTYSLTELPVIMLTSHDSSEKIVEALDAGANDYITKSAEASVLFARIRNQLITKRLEEAAQSAAQEAEHANSAKSIFLANMSHEIRTPMNAILGFTQIMGRASDLPEHHRKAIKTIEQSGEHLLGLINDILDISKIEAGHEQLNQTDFNLHEMVQGLGTMFEMRCRQNDLVWKLEADVAAGLVHGDEGKLRQVLINLLGNAVKFTSKGEVRLKVQKRDEDQVYFEVCDAGPGIPEEKQASIFEPFHQEEAGMRQGGTGLGLAISRRQTELMGGKIDLESTPGAGSRFFFTLVLPPAQALVQSKPSADWSGVRHLAEGQSVRALIVDDEPTNRDILSQMLDEIGVNVETAENGEQALALVGKQMPDIVFLDIRMPVMDGTETLERLFGAHGREATVAVAVTGLVFDHQRQHYLEMGFDGFLDKPLRAEQVYACLSEHLGVEFEFLKAMDAPEAAKVDWRGVELPEAVHADLTSAAELHSITDLRRHIDVLEGFGADGQQLAAHLRELAQQYDFSGINTVLEEINPQ